MKKYLTTFFLLNKNFLGAGVRVTDLHGHVWIIATCWDCVVAGYQPKSVVFVVRVTLIDDWESWAAQLHQVSPETWAFMLRAYDMIQKAFRNEAMYHTQVKE